MRLQVWTVTAIVAGVLAAPLPALAQLGSIGRAIGRANQVRQDFTFSEAEERQMGSDISTRLREKYGVVQDRAVHRYVTLVGSVLARESSRPNLGWTFIVLDTDGVNAFAAPGGFVHITRGALALMQNEAELADVLGHEIGHVTAKHTLNAIQKSKGIEAVGQLSRQEFVSEITERAYAAVLENSFDRGDEMDADKTGITLASRAGYAPTGLGAFLTRLSERNKGLQERSGMFASHPETRARLDALTRTIASSKLTATALVAARYTQAITFKPVPVAAVRQTAAAPASAGGGGSSGRSGGFGLSNLTALGRERSSDQTVSSAGSRGVNPDRDAAGGANKALVSVTVSAAELAEFRRGITG
jgi:predicted Zn-dependent protease